MRTPIKSKLKSFILFFGLLISYSCLEPYTPKVNIEDTNFLVVDGFVNVDAQTILKLSRTATLENEKPLYVKESSALVFIEDEDGTSVQFSEGEPGSYYVNGLPFDGSRNVRLKITTNNSEEFMSDFVPVKKSQPIDSVNWVLEGDDVHFYVNSHDPSNNTRYYYWNFEGTWEYHSAYYSQVLWDAVNDTVLQRPISDDIYHCWKTIRSTDILVGSTVRLVDDIVSNFEISQERITSEKLQKRYSLLVHQFALTQDAYEYWEQLKKNTENLGTIFGTLPSQSFSNIHNVKKPTQPVIGYFSVGAAQEKRIFINSTDMRPSRHDSGYETCTADTLKKEDIPFYSGAEILISEVYKGTPPVFVGYLRSTYECVDCTYHNGVKQKPDFW